MCVLFTLKRQCFLLFCHCLQLFIYILYVWVSRSVVPGSLQPRGLQRTRLLCPWNSPGKNTGVGCRFLLQEIFPTQRSNLDFMHCRQILYHLSHLPCNIHIRSSHIKLPFVYIKNGQYWQFQTIQPNICVYVYVLCNVWVCMCVCVWGVSTLHTLLQ